jgi:hypothetical protein
MRWTFSAGRHFEAAKRAGARHGAKVLVVFAGATVALGTAIRPVEVTQPAPLVNRVVAFTPAIAEAATPSLATELAFGGGRSLDRGIEHSRIDKWVSRFSSSAGFKQALQRMERYEPMITQKLDAKQMPRDLIYVAMIESEFHPAARSHASAVGMWQFMRATAKRFGLTVGKKVDERKNPARSTDAALAYLEKLHDRFGSWYLAAAAYNSGEGRVGTALKRVTGKSKGTDADFFRIMHTLPQETRDYVPKLIAATRVGNAHAKYGGE